MVYFPDWMASLFNARCPFCGDLFGERPLACTRCIGEIARLQASAPAAGTSLEIATRPRNRVLRVHSLAAYEGWVKNLILSNKRDPNAHVTRLLAEALLRILPEEARGLAVVWTPGRRFGPVHLVEALALELHRQGAPLIERPVFARKALRSRPQKTLRVSERKAVDRAGRFRISPVNKVEPRQKHKRPASRSRDVVLLDDICTTGATLTGLANALEAKTGLVARHALVVAHTPLRSENQHSSQSATCPCSV